MRYSKNLVHNTTALLHTRCFSLLCFPGEPDKELNPKKKVWEAVQPDLKTDGQCVANYKGAPFEIAGKGVCKAQTMSNSGIK